MARDEARESRAERAARRVDHVLLRAAGVGDHGPRTRGGRHRDEQRRELRDRRRDQHDVGVANLARPVAFQQARPVDDRPCERRIEIRLRAADADDLADRPRAPQRQRARSADQADADDGKFLDAHFEAPGR